MTKAQREQCPDLYRALKLASIRAGESVGQRTVFTGRYERPVRRG